MLVDKDEAWKGTEGTDNISILHLGELICLGFTALNLNLVVFVLWYFTPLHFIHLSFHLSLYTHQFECLLKVLFYA